VLFSVYYAYTSLGVQTSPAESLASSG
jgi:hypothetical protein